VVGIPLALDNCTMGKTLGFYARVLVYVDLLSSLLQQLLMESLGFAFCSV